MRILLCISFILSLLTANAQVLFTAEASRYTVGVGETFTVTFTVNADGSNFKYPDFTGFKVVSGPMTSMSTQIVNGRMSQEQSASFDLIALKEGTFTIGPAQVKAEGKQLKSKALKIKVVPASQRKPNSLEQKAAELAGVKILTNKRSVYVGEPLAVRYVLTLKTNVGNYNILEQPDFEGFIKNDVEIKRITTKKEEIDGQMTTTADIGKFILIPQKAGDIKPGKLSLQLPTQVPTGRRTWFGEAETRTINQVATSSFPRLKVKALPANAPASFSGGVGDYKFYVNLSRNEVKADESITLTIEVAGKGNLQLLELPKPKLPNSIESYEPKYKESINVKPTGISGYKRFEYLLLPRYKGEYKIPRLAFSFFNPKTEQYVTLESEPLIINVTEGPQQVNTPQNNGPVVADKNTVQALGEDILFIHTTPSTFEKEKTSLFTSLWHWLSIILLLVLVVITYIYQQFRQTYKPDKKAQAKRKALRKAEKKIKDAQGLISGNDVVGFYGSLSEAFQTYFDEKFGLSKSNFTADAIHSAISSNNGENELAEEVVRLLNQADVARFAPVSQANMQNDYKLALSTLSKIDQLK